MLYSLYEKLSPCGTIGAQLNIGMLSFLLNYQSIVAGYSIDGQYQIAIAIGF